MKTICQNIVKKDSLYPLIKHHVPLHCVLRVKAWERDSCESIRIGWPFLKVPITIFFCQFVKLSLYCLFRYILMEIT